MPYKNIDCPIEEPTEEPYGEFANAIRLRVDGAEVLLDFCVYSEAENKARVVSRIRVSKGFLPTLQTKLNDALTPPSGSPHMLYVMPPVDE